jgi:hypothetical protein
MKTSRLVVLPVTQRMDGLTALQNPLLGSQSPSLQQFSITTRTAPSPMNTGCGVEGVREANRENYEQKDRQRAKNYAATRVKHARQWPQTATARGASGKKNPNL